MTDEKLKRANELKEFIERISEKLGDMAETKRLATTPFGENNRGKVHCVDIISAEFKVKARWNQENNEQTFNETIEVPAKLIGAIWKMIEDEMEKQFAKAVEEYENL